MARIPDSEIERLKSEVSVERLIESCGIPLKKTGKDLTGCCPFHEERLVVRGHCIHPELRVWPHKIPPVLFNRVDNTP